MTNSIFDSIKKTLNVDPEDDGFDVDILMHINTTFSRLHTLGVGPEDGFMIEDDSVEWDDFLNGDKTKNLIKSYMYLSVRMLFDPPQTSYTQSAMEKQIDRLEWLINAQRESTGWVDPDPSPLSPVDIIDGGSV